MSKRGSTYNLRSCSKQQKTKEPSNEESQIDKSFIRDEINTLPDQIPTHYNF